MGGPIDLTKRLYGDQTLRFSSTLTENGLAFWMTPAGTVCWRACFWWMHRLSKKNRTPCWTNFVNLLERLTILSFAE